jgi:DNA-binding response OmpR family regulator
MRVLLVEDHAPLAENVAEYLTLHGFEVDFAYDGATALQLATAHSYDAIVLDLTLPKLDGIEVCRRLRQDLAVPAAILMLTARDALADKLTGFNSGADDYLTKPFELDELRVRLHAIARRARTDATLLRVADLEFDTGRRVVKRANSALKLSPTGLRILEILMRRTPNVVSRQELLYRLWGENPPEAESALRVHLHSLRNAIDRPFDTPLLHTVSGVGYCVANNQSRG